ncbi:unnamed protein product [Aureobasidium vineae]|uniref:Uncharacterized protein n=1 Tax=Aureobasidium vineae TaxID=2773715 RepID=A0A9N8K0S6_9PEZI|nr:unnamed protein product [Aureobasidium vineae]
MNATQPPTPNSGHGDATPRSLNPSSADRVATPSSSSPTPASEPLILSEYHVQQAQPDELRAMVARLMPLLQEARSEAAHHKLQYQMLAIETNEAMERIRVEMDMAQRETELLGNTNDPVEPRIIQQSDPSIRRVHADIWKSMVEETQSLKSQNAQLEQIVSQHKRMVVQQESEIATLNDRITLYRERLRENRSHLNRYRRAAGFLESPRKSQSVQSSPWTTHERDQPPFAALLHASDLMSGRSPTTPQTPTRRRRAASITSMPYETPQTLQSTRYLQVPQTAPPLRRPELQFSNSERLASTRHQTTVLKQVLVADESDTETDVPDEESAKDSGSVARMPQTPTRTHKSSLKKTYSDASQQRLFGQVRKASMQRDESEALAKVSVPEQTRSQHISNV